ncbi:MAG TPA: helix-turn-helix transcriptional regulator [Pyrinomonadaceae bacterium]|jgi:DNA-binding PadR family transcriptional regulator
MGKKFLGEFEELILLAILTLSDNAYGVPIAETIEKFSGKRVSIGALYTSLGRLEEKGFIRSWVGEASEAQGGRAKKYYAVEGAGMQVLKDIEATRSIVVANLNWGSA